MTRAEIDARVARAWDEGAWTLDEFAEDTGLPHRTIEESCLRLYLENRIHFDPPQLGDTPKTKGTKQHGNRKQTTKPNRRKARSKARSKARRA